MHDDVFVATPITWYTASNPQGQLNALHGSLSHIGEGIGAARDHPTQKLPL